MRSKSYKFLTLLTALILGFGQMWGQDVTLADINYTQWDGTAMPANSGLSNSNTYYASNGTSRVATLVGKGCKLDDSSNQPTATGVSGSYEHYLRFGSSGNYLNITASNDLVKNAGETSYGKVRFLVSSQKNKTTDELAEVKIGETSLGKIYAFTSTSTCDWVEFDIPATVSKNATITLTRTTNTLFVWGIQIKTFTSSSSPVSVTGITLAPSSVTIKVGKTVTLVPTITPSDATDKAVTWAVTSGSSYASVTDAGVVTGLAAGTAVVTATAHDGSGVTQTATITVEDCPTSGTLFSMTVTDPDGTVYTDVTNAAPQLIGATYVGGKAYATSTSSSKRSPKITGDEFDFNVSSSSSVAVKVELDCPLAEGDMISFTSTHTKEFKIQKVAGTNLHQTSSLSLAIPSGSSLIDEDVFYVLCANSACSFSEINIIRPIYRTITLEYADGVTPDGSLKVIDGEKAAKPADPTWAHHRFDGWYNGATPYDWTANVTGNLTLTAHWTQLYTVTYEAGDGTATGDAPTEADKAATETFTVAANPFTVAGKDFVKWNDGTNDYTPGATYTVGTDNVVLTAQWKAAADKYTVIFKDGETELGTKLFEVSTNPSDADIDKTKALFTFAAWQKEGVDIALDAAFWATVVKDATVTLTARWTKAYASSVDLEGLVEASGTSADWQTYLTNHGYAFSTSNVSLDEKKDPSENKPYDNWPYQGLKAKVVGAYVEGNIEANKLVIIKLGHMAADATITVDGVAQANATGLDAAEPAGAMNYYYLASEGLLRYETTNAGACVLKAITITDPYTVSFAAHGDGDPADLQGTPSVNLPTPTNGTASFLGWFDAETGGNKIGEAGETYTTTANITLHAQWEAVSTDARLASITFSSAAGTLSPAFDPEVTSYTYTMPYGTAAVPTITGATKVNDKGQDPVIDAQASDWGETAQVHGVAESGDTKNYYVQMLRAPKDGVEIIGAVVTGNTTANVTGVYKGTASVKLNDKKIDKGDYYIYVTLKDGQTLQNGDILVVDVNTKSGIGTQALEICTGEGNLNNGILTSIAVDDYSTGENTIVLASVPAGATSIGLKRSDNLNAKINGLKVYRPMNPILTAIQFNDTKVDVTGTTIAATLPNGTDLGAMTITPTIVWNGAGTAVAANTWEWSVANTYTVTDKDGDATVYTITLTEAIPAVDPTLTYNEGAYMVGATALDLSTLITASTSTGAITYSVKTDGGTGATIDGNNFTATAAGTATITASQAAVSGFNAKTVDFDVVVAVATEKDGVKLVEADALTGNFRVAAAQFKSGGYTIDGITYANHFEMSSNVSSDAFAPDAAATKHINYTMTKKAAKFWLYTYNTYTSAYKVYAFVKEEGEDVATHSVSVENGAHLVSIDVSVNKNAEVFFATENKSKMVICQIVAVESGDALLQGGEQDYVIDLANGRLNASSATLRTIDGIEYMLSGDYKVAGTSYAKIATFGTHYVKFTLASPLEVNITTANTAAYYVGTTLDTEDDNSKLNETSPTKNVASNFSLAAGTYYISPKSSEVQISKLEFSAPKCAEPVIDAQPASKLDFAAGDMTASVTAHATDGGSLSYQWYNASDDSEVTGADEATLTTTEEGTYYVIVTNTLADHSDNFVKSDNATLKYRKADDATLSSLIVSEGTLDPVFDSEVLEYNVTLTEGTVDVPTLTATAAMAAYGATADVTNATAFVNYEATSTVLVTAEDHSTQQTYTVHFYVEHTILALVDVTGDMTWDFSKANDGTAAASSMCTDEIMANVAGIVNDANFESDNIKVTANKFAGAKLQASMITFHTTVDGLIKVVFSNTGDKSSERYLVVNGKKTDSGTKTKTNITYYGFVPAGDVVLTVIEGDGNMLNFASVQFTAKATPDYKRDASTGDSWMAPGELGTVCIPNGAVATGGDLYTLEGKNSDGKIVFATVPNNRMTPGVPYLFQATSNAMKFFYTDETPATEPANEGHAMKGSFTNYTLTEGLANVYYFNGHALWSCASLTELPVVQYRAYVKMDEVSEIGGGASGAPGRRYIIMDVHGQNATTDVDLLNSAEAPVKMIIDGKMYILRGEKMYNANGQLVK